MSKTEQQIAWIALIVLPSWIGGATVAGAFIQHEWSLLVASGLLASIVLLCLYIAWCNQ